MLSGSIRTDPNSAQVLLDIKKQSGYEWLLMIVSYVNKWNNLVVVVMRNLWFSKAHRPKLLLDS
jgi:hypothetical protein